MQNHEETHIIPGGRREPGEKLEQTLRRELLEETGWHIENMELRGYIHYHHLKPKPEGYPYPYPDFMQVIYTAQATTYHAEARIPDGYSAEFHSLEYVSTLELTVGERYFIGL